MVKFKYQTYMKDLSLLRRHVMRSLAKSDTFALIPYGFDNLLTFSLKTESGEEVYPFFFTDFEELLAEAAHFLKQYDLTLDLTNEQQKKYQIR